ncbi:tetratricopeptide repeat protein [Sphingomonas profundi]|uniref:tetratricopeptide repeat protein n=1 Tax=Alterirhizorhabdus profundi TaxID=2681549 RepID=UPI0012E79A92|nr:tetratricopeptide repeat protein [Sphingomonas profundi]
MNRAVVIKFAASAALLGTVAVGCKPASHPASLSSVAPRADREAAKLADRAGEALARKDAVAAVKFAEDAVALAPREAGNRLLLGRAYIASGRFKSAETAFADALALTPGDGQAELSLALARIALGKWDDARALLASAKGKVGESDRGLALALAGDKDGGVQALEAAARATGADAKARQNLALGYALSGRWAESASIAAQDLPPAMVKARMTEWAHLSQPRDAWDQIAALMHVTPIEDGGMPAALALAPEATPAVPEATAAADPAPLPAEAPAPVMATAAAEPAAPAEPAAAEIAQVEPQAPSPAAAVAPVAVPDAAPAPYLVEAAATTPPPLIAAPAKPGRLLIARKVPAPVRQSATGRYVVQLGAFANAATVESAWRSTARRLNRVAGLTPYQAKFGAVHRLSLAGFETRGAAVALCQQIRAARGECFVRVNAGDAMAQWVKPGIRLASR